MHKNYLTNYKAAISDYTLWLKIIEAENKGLISEQNKWLTKNKIDTEKKRSFGLTHATFIRMSDIAECYLNLRDYRNAIVWLNKGIISLKEYREHNRNSDELSSKYEGIIHYYKAISHSNLREMKIACNEIELAFNYGYDAEECKRLKLEINCNANTVPTNSINSIPMMKKAGVYEVPVIINGVLKLNFIFDAGATDISISPDVALTLIKTGTVSDADFIGTENYKLADGSTIKSKVFLIKEIQLGNKKINNVKASISNSVKAPLLLGQSVLNKFGKVTIDYNKGVILFEG